MTDHSHSSLDDDDVHINNGDMLNYKGYFVERAPHGDDNGDNDEQRFYEFGAHFPYYFLVQKLEILKLEEQNRAKSRLTTVAAC